MTNELHPADPMSNEKFVEWWRENEDWTGSEMWSAYRLYVAELLGPNAEHYGYVPAVKIKGGLLLWTWS